MASVVSCSSLWEHNEIRPLIAIWSETNVQELDGAVRNKREHIRKYLISSKSRLQQRLGTMKNKNKKIKK